MGARKIERGYASQYAMENVRRLRERRGMSAADLAAALTIAGRSMQPGAVGKIERGERRLDADDLVALALALGVHPSALLLPPQAGDEEVPLTSTTSAPGWAVWQWAHGQAPLPSSSEADGYNTLDELEDFQLHAIPAELRRREAHPAVRALRRVAEVVTRSITNPPKARARAGRRDAYERARAALDTEITDLIEGRD